MLALDWMKVVPGMNSIPFVRVTEDHDAPVVAGAFQDHAFIPGVYDPKTKTCVIKDNDTPEEEFYVMKPNAFIQLEWIADKGGQVPVGSLQCGSCFKGTALYVGRFKCDGRLLCGKVNELLGGCSVKILGQQYFSSHYEVLCLKTIPFGFYYYNLHAFKGCRPRKSLGDSKMSFPECVGASPDKNSVVTPHRLTSRQNHVVARRTMTSFQNTTIFRSQTRLGTIFRWDQAPKNLFTPIENTNPIKKKENTNPIKKKKILGKPTSKWQRQNGKRLIRSPSKISHH